MNSSNSILDIVPAMVALILVKVVDIQPYFELALIIVFILYMLQRMYYLYKNKGK